MAVSPIGVLQPFLLKSVEEKIDEIKTGISTQVRANRSSGKAIQINGSVGGEYTYEVVGKKVYQYVPVYSKVFSKFQ